MKKIRMVFAGIIAMVFLVACGGPTNSETEDGNLSVSIEIAGEMNAGRPVTFEAVPNKAVVSYQWSGAVNGDTKSVQGVFAEGNYSVTVKVIDADEKTAMVSRSFEIGGRPRNIVERYTGLDGLDANSSFYRDENGWHKTDQNCTFEKVNGEIDLDSIKISNLPMHHTVTTDAELGKVIIVCSMDNAYYRNILEKAGADKEDLKFDDILELKICSPGDNAFCSQGRDDEVYIQGLGWGDATDPNNIVFQGMQVLIYK